MGIKLVQKNRFSANVNLAELSVVAGTYGERIRIQALTPAGENLVCTVSLPEIEALQNLLAEVQADALANKAQGVRA